MSSSVTEFIIELLEEKEPLPGGSIEEKARFRYLDAGVIDSFALMQFIMQIEAEFDIALDPEDTQSDEFRWVGGLASIVERKTS